MKNLLVLALSLFMFASCSSDSEVSSKVEKVSKSVKSVENKVVESSKEKVSVDNPVIMVGGSLRKPGLVGMINVGLKTGNDDLLIQHISLESSDMTREEALDYVSNNSRAFLNITRCTALDELGDGKFVMHCMNKIFATKGIVRINTVFEDGVHKVILPVEK